MHVNKNQGDDLRSIALMATVSYNDTVGRKNNTFVHAPYQNNITMPMHLLTDHIIKEIYQPVLRGQLSQTQRNF